MQKPSDPFLIKYVGFLLDKAIGHIFSVTNDNHFKKRRKNYG